MIISDIFDAAGVDVKPSSSENYEVTICCPFCVENGLSADDGYHMGVNIKRGLGHCFRCDWKGRGVIYLARQLCRVYGVPFRIRARSVKEEKEEERPTPARPEPKLAGLPREYEAFQGELDIVGKRVRDYLRSRGVSLLQLVRHKIGYAGAGSMSWRALFPVIDADGRVHGCVGRAIRSDMSPKYLNTPGMKILWNAQNGNGVAVVVEGIMDALRVEGALLRTRNMTAVARLGSAVTASELDQLKEFDAAYVIPDWDRTGVRGAMELCERASDRGIRCFVSIPEVMDGSDPGDKDEEQILDLIRGVELWSSAAEHRLRASMSRAADLVGRP
jgi:DNA primase